MVQRFADLCIRFRAWLVGLLAFITLFHAWNALNINVETVFEDLLPQSHPYVETHEQFKDAFGSSNMVTIMIEPVEGDIFQTEVLRKVQYLTRELRTVPAVDDYQIVSLAARKLKEVTGSTAGIDTRSLMWPEVPTTQAELDQLRESVVTNPVVMGTYVSEDLHSTLITADFIDHLVDYEVVFNEIRALIDDVDDASVNVRLVGDPILYGWVNHYLTETLQLALLALLVMAVVLFALVRTWRGTLLPLVSGFASGSWALGTASLLGIHFDPLVVVVAVLITSRAVSHSVQIVTRFEEELSCLGDVEGASRRAASNTLRELFRPGLLGIATDAGCVAVVALSPIPLLQKLAFMAITWISTVAVSAIILTPVLLSWVNQARVQTRRRLDPLRPVLNLALRTVASRARVPALVTALVVLVGSGYFAFGLQVGDANPGSPILWPDSTYNQDSAAVNANYHGADRMFIVASGEEEGFVQRPEVLANMNRLQRFMEAQPQVGGTLSVADILPTVHRVLREGNPHYQELPNDALMTGELMYIFESVSEPGDLDQFVDSDKQHAGITLFFQDRQGETIRTALARLNEYIDNNPLEGGEYLLAGGLIGLLGAVNEVILAGQIQSIALALLVLVVMCTLVYRSSMAGMFFMVPVIMSNTLTFSFMAWQGIGMNINTVPVAALGIGLGVDYALYICDRIREELRRGGDELQAYRMALHSAGRAVLVTAAVLIASTLLWWASSLRFQAEMGLLMGLWLTVSAVTALFVMPSLVYVFKPRFIYRDFQPEPRPEAATTGDRLVPNEG